MFFDSDFKLVTPATAPAFLTAATMLQKAILTGLEKSNHEDFTIDSDYLFALRQAKKFINHCLVVMNDENKVTALTVVQDERH